MAALIASSVASVDPSVADVAGRPTLEADPDLSEPHVPFDRLAAGEALSITPRPLDPRPGAIDHAPAAAEYEVSIEDGFEAPSSSGGTLPEPLDVPFGSEAPVASSADVQTHPSVAGRPDGSVLFVAYTNQTGPMNRDVYVARSTDGGLTWTHLALASATYNESDPRVVVHGSRVFIFFSADDPALPRGFRYAVSMDQGLSWSVLGLDFTGAPFRDLRNPDAFSADGQWLYAVYEATCDAGSPGSPPCFANPYQVLVTTLFDASGTIAPPSTYFPFAIDTIEPAIYSGPTITMWIADIDASGVGGSPGDRDVVWMMVDTGLNCPDGAMGCPAGQGWRNAFVTGFFTTDATRPDAGGFGANFTFVYQFVNATQGINDRIIVSLYNQADGDIAGWALSTIAGEPGVQLKDPAIFASAPLLHVSFVRGADLGYIYSADGSSSWTSPVKVNSNTGTVVDQVRSNDITYAGKVHVAFVDNRLGNEDIFHSTFLGWSFYVFDRSPRPGTLTIDAETVTVFPSVRFWDEGSVHAVSAPPEEPLGPGARLAFDQWSDGNTSAARTITVGPSDVALTAVYRQEFLLNMSANVGTTNPTTSWFGAGTVVSIAWIPPAPEPGVRHVFQGWNGTGPGSYTGPANPSTVTMDGPIEEIANATREIRFVFDTDPAGLGMQIDGVPFFAPQTVWWEEGTSHAVDAISPQQPGSAIERFVFSRWGDGSTQNPRAFSANVPANHTAVFDLEYLASIETDPPGRNVTVDGTTGVAPLTAWWRAGTVHLVAVPSPQLEGADTRYVFASWSDGGPRSHQVTASTPLSLTVTFSTEYRFEFDTAPTGLDVVLDGAAPVPAPQSIWWEEGTTHTVELLTPQAVGPGTRRVFDTWSDGNTQNPRTFAGVTGPRSLTASYRTQHLLTVETPYGGKVGEEWYDAGTAALAGVDAGTVAGPPGTQFVFVRWSGDAGGTSFAQSNPVTMDGPKTAVAEWKRQVLLQVAVEPAVPEVQATIDGLAVPAEGTFVDEGVTITVTVPMEVESAGKTYRFVGWTGATGGASTSLTPTDPITLIARYREVGPLESPAVLGGLIAAILAAVLLAFFFLWWRRRRKPEEAVPPGGVAPPPGPPTPPGADTMACPSCGLTIEAKAGPCPICGAEVTPPQPVEDERVRQLEEAYRTGRISEAQYRENLEKLRKR